MSWDLMDILALVAFCAGFYDGIFGPGVGSFFIVGFVLLCGIGMMRAMSFTKHCQCLLQLRFISYFYHQRRYSVAGRNNDGRSGIYGCPTRCASGCSGRPTVN